MAFSAIIGAVVIGVVFGIGKLSDHGFVRWPCWAFVEFFRAVPVLMLMVLFYYQFGITRGESGAYWSVVFALTVYNGAVLAEVFRAGVLAVPRGQAEAAYAMGMRKSQVMMIIQLPQAVKIMIPAIISQCVVALKDTSLGYAVTSPGLTAVGKQIYIQFANHVPTVIVIAAIYITLNLILTGIATWVQKQVRRGAEDRHVQGGRRDGHRENTGGAGCPDPAQPFLGVTQSLIVPSMTTVPSLRTPRTRTGTLGSSPVHCSGSVSAMQVMSVVALAV